MARRDAYRLALLRFGKTSLETVWQKAHEESTKQLSEGLVRTLEPSKRYEIEEIRGFVAKHPSSSSKRDTVENLFGEIRFGSGQEHATFLKTVFDRHVEEELRKIDASDEEIMKWPTLFRRTDTQDSSCLEKGKLDFATIGRYNSTR